MISHGTSLSLTNTPVLHAYSLHTISYLGAIGAVFKAYDRLS